jgi:hypothetical protein
MHPPITTPPHKEVSFYRQKILLALVYSYPKLKNDVHSQALTHKVANGDRPKCQTLSTNSSIRNAKCLELNYQKRLSKRKSTISTGRRRNVFRHLDSLGLSLKLTAKILCLSLKKVTMIEKKKNSKKRDYLEKKS